MCAAEGIWEVSALTAQFCCKPKTVLKIKKNYNNAWNKIRGRKKCYSPKFPNLNKGREEEKCEMDSN